METLSIFIILVLALSVVSFVVSSWCLFEGQPGEEGDTGDPGLAGSQGPEGPPGDDAVHCAPQTVSFVVPGGQVPGCTLTMTRDENFVYLRFETTNAVARGTKTVIASVQFPTGFFPTNMENQTGIVVNLLDLDAKPSTLLTRGGSKPISRLQFHTEGYTNPVHLVGNIVYRRMDDPKN